MREKFGASRFAECRNGHVQPTTSTAGPSSALMHDRLEKQLPKVIAKRRHRWGKFDALLPPKPDVHRWHGVAQTDGLDRKSTRLNSSHLVNSYAVFCLKKNAIS